MTCLDTQIPQKSYQVASGNDRSSKVFGFTLYKEETGSTRRRLAAKEIPLVVNSGCFQIIFSIPHTRPLHYDRGEFTKCEHFAHDTYTWSGKGCSEINQTADETWCQCTVND